MMRTSKPVALARMALLAAALTVTEARVRAAPNGALTRVSVGSSGVQANGASYDCNVSEDGRFVVFQSYASNLVANDTNALADIFLHDRLAGTTELVSVSSLGQQANQQSKVPDVSADGRFVCFVSAADNLVSGDTSTQPKVFLRDRVLGTTTLLTRGLGGVDADGGSGGSLSISADGSRVVFSSAATNLVPGDTNGFIDAFVYFAGAIERVSVGPGGVEANGYSSPGRISANGRFLPFRSTATNLAPGSTSRLFVRDLVAGQNSPAPLPPASTAFLQGGGLAQAVSDDGNYLVIWRWWTDLQWEDYSDYWLYDYGADALTLITMHSGPPLPDSQSGGGDLSADGNLVVYHSDAPDLIPGGTVSEDVYCWDRLTGQTTLVNVGSSGPSTGGVWDTAIASNGGTIVFQASAGDLVPGDTNGLGDIFARDCTPPPATYCAGKLNSIGLVPFVSFTGLPSLTSSTPFRITGEDVIPGTTGFLIYGSQSANLPFHGGKLCVKAPFTRLLPVKKADGHGGIWTDFNVRIQTGIDPILTLGGKAYAQWYTRDTGAPFGDGLTDAIAFTVGF